MSATELSSDEVVVTVTTRRTDAADGVREATVRGPFETALRTALAQRLAQWAVEQVLPGVLSRRPARGEPAEYTGSFKETRTLCVRVRPAIGVGAEMPVKKVRQLPGLFIPEAVWRERSAP
jgi:hypothetical protein